jgi:hypothetical protein
MGTNTTGRILFYTGLTERMTINTDGTVGIGASVPISRLTINPVPIQLPSVFDYSLSPITITNSNPTSTTAINDPKPVLHLCRDGTGGQSYASKATFNLCRYENSAANSRTRLDIALTNDAFNDVNIMSLRSDGTVGIGTTNTFSYKLMVNSGISTAATTYAMRIASGTFIDTGANFGTLIGLGTEINSWSKCAIGHVRTNAYDVGSIVFLCRNTSDSTTCDMADEKMRINKDGNVGIGTINPGNILQVGDGGRLRISNNNTDYTLIGTKNGIDNSNTRIEISGNSRATKSGNIEYIATTATGAHTFCYNGTNALLDMDVNDITAYNSITTIGANFYTDGEYLVNMTRTNTAGNVKQGYFHTTEYFFNSLVTIAISHNDTTYSYWHGYLGTNNSTQIMYITAFQQSNITIENFVEQTTNKTFIYLRPTGTYNASVQMRVKFYG